MKPVPVSIKSEERGTFSRSTARSYFGRRTWIMGILNVTPDSFSDGDLFDSREAAVEQGLRLSVKGQILSTSAEKAPVPGPIRSPPEKN